MLKKLPVHILIGSVSFISGIYLLGTDWSKYKIIGNVLSFGGAAYAGIAIILFLFFLFRKK